jgi:hypothetical protein
MCFVMFSPYVNHAAQQMADVSGRAWNWRLPNILHLRCTLLRRSVNITMQLRKRLGVSLFASSCLRASQNLARTSRERPEANARRHQGYRYAD